MSDFFHQLHIFAQNLSWRDGIDVLICAFLLYELFLLIRGTQAVQLLAGLAVLFVVGVAAQALHLRLLEFIFANAGQAIVIAAVVLFQPELRRALDQVGRFGSMRFLSHSQGDTERILDEVLRAARTLSERKAGALIVAERDTGLDNIASTGVRINGEVTAEMLASIFFPKAPLHDGAVLLRDNRLIAAGCVLPLADAIPGTGRMGTRHRAAVGLTVQCDAVVLVVSEETGLITIAHEGKLFRGLDADAQREMLLTLMVSSRGDGKRRRQLARPFAQRAFGRRTVKNK